MEEKQEKGESVSKEQLIQLLYSSSDNLRKIKSEFESINNLSFGIYIGLIFGIFANIFVNLVFDLIINDLPETTKRIITLLLVLILLVTLIIDIKKNQARQKTINEIDTTLKRRLVLRERLENEKKK